jgi:hypothetical protein
VCGITNKEPLASGGSNCRREPVRLRAYDPLPKACNAVIPPAFVVENRIGPLAGFLHQPRRQHSFQAPIKSAGTELQSAFTMRGDFLHDAVSMALAITQSQQDVKDGRPKRQELFG